VARGPGGPPVTFGGTIAGAGDRQLFGIELTDAANVFVEVGIPVIGQCSGGDPVAELYDASMNPVAANDDSFGFCSYINPITDAAARVPAGRYTLAIRAFDSVSSLPTFEVRIELRAVGCGNAILETGEGCDDGNTGAGDGCSAVCQPE
jgi:cysteine-rich repeat protein